MSERRTYAVKFITVTQATVDAENIAEARKVLEEDGPDGYDEGSLYTYPVISTLRLKRDGDDKPEVK